MTQNEPFQMDEIDKKILMILQIGLPLESHPYKIIGDQVGISEDEVLERIAKLKGENPQNETIIRRMSGFFNSNQMGYKSLLCAISVEENRIDEVAKIIDGYTGITHNYIRTHKFNMWFTLIAKDDETVEKTLAEIEKKANSGRIMRLPANERFKINVTFDLGV